MSKGNLQIKRFMLLVVLTFLVSSIAPTIFMRPNSLGFVPDELAILIGVGIVIFYTAFFAIQRIKKNDHCVLALPLGLALTWIPSFILDYLGGLSHLQYLSTGFILYFYSIPCTIISLIIAIILLVILRKRNRN